ncbi:Transposase IS4 [Popillia japonica]|uniref:Transposase IS4 n=1 Tax=Popillia japonica TaxID=7064 RepID=A0AAW1N3W5_POPJA
MEEVLTEMDAENNEQEAPDDEESEHEIDLVETRSSNTDTDQEISDGDTENETDIGSNELFYTGKDLLSKWKKHVPNGNRRVLQRNILRQRLPGNYSGRIHIEFGLLEKFRRLRRVCSGFCEAVSSAFILNPELLLAPPRTNLRRNLRIPHGPTDRTRFVQLWEMNV